MKKYALLIGIEDYHDETFSWLRFARADALGLAERLRDGCQFDSVQVLAEDNGKNEPILRNIMTSLCDMAGELRDEDLFLFFFAGHGLESSGRGYLMVRDTPASSPRIGSLPMEELQSFLKDIQPKKRIILLDACRNSPRTNRSDSANYMSDVFSRDIVAAVENSARYRSTTTAVLVACQEGQRAYEWPTKRHGVFTHYLIEGIDKALRHDEPLDFRSLAGYVSREVRLWSNSTPNLPMLQEPWYQEYGDPEPLYLISKNRAKRPIESVVRNVEIAPSFPSVEERPEVVMRTSQVAATPPSKMKTDRRGSSRQQDAEPLTKSSNKGLRMFASYGYLVAWLYSALLGYVCSIRFDLAEPVRPLMEFSWYFIFPSFVVADSILKRNYLWCPLRAAVSPLIAGYVYGEIVDWAAPLLQARLPALLYAIFSLAIVSLARLIAKLIKGKQQ